MSIVRRGEVVDPNASPSDRAVNRLEREGIALPGKPTFENDRLPEDLTTLVDEDLMNLFVRLTSWCGYLNARASAAMVDERTAEAHLEIAQAQSLIANWTGGKEDRVTIAKAQRMLDPSYMRMRKVHEDAYAYRKLVETLASNTERDAAVVSREITRRTSTNPVDQRGRRFTV